MKFISYVIVIFLSFVTHLTFGQVTNCVDCGGNPPATPGIPTVSTNTCGDKIVTRSGTPPAGVTWYWQTSVNGVDQTYSGATYTVSADGNSIVYLRSYQASTGLWGGSAPIQVTVNAYPAEPPMPSTTYQCGQSTLTRATPPSTPAGNTWYWQTDPNGTDMSNSGTTFIVNSSGLYYLRGRSSAGCWGTAVGFGTMVYFNPPAPSAPTITYQCGQTILTQNNSTSDTWYWQGVDANGTSTANSLQTLTIGQFTGSQTYYIRALSTQGCWSASTGVSVTVTPKPVTPNTPILPPAGCGPISLSFNGSPEANVSWYWQTSSTATSTSLGNTSPLVVSESNTYYLRGYNSSMNCWSDAASAPVTTNYLPAEGLPSAAGVSRQEPGVVTLSGTLGSGGYELKWYDAPTNGNLLTTALTYTTNITATTTFYVTSHGNCYSARVPVVADVTPRPVIDYTSSYFIQGKSITLSVPNNTYTTYSWKKDGVVVGNAATLVVTNQPGVYTVSVTKTGFTGTGTSDPVTLYAANLNAIGINTIKNEAVTLETAIAALPATDNDRKVQYLAGFGNVLQTVLAKNSLAQNDIILPVEYDVHGRQLKAYLPYVSATNDALYRGLALNNGGYAGSEQYSFYQTATKIAHDTKPYALGEIEASPLGRTMAETGVGDDWHTNSKKTTHQYLLNRTTDGVRVWTISAGLPVSTTTYGDYQLFVDLVTDENGNRMKRYTDKIGRVILTEQEVDATTWLRTYSIYDDKGRLAFTLSPEGTKAANFSPLQTFLDQWAFQYRYDNLNRLVESKAPAAGWIYTVYDVLNRPVMSQNADQRSRSEWTFTKYDIYGRAVMVGFKVIASSTRTSVQGSVDTQSFQFELNTTDAIGYTLNRSYPTVVEADLLSINYYDNYAFLAYTGWDAEAHSFAFVAEQGNTTYEGDVIGLATGAKIKIINGTTWLNAVQYYDKLYRPLQVISENHLNGLDRNTNKYNNLRQLTETRLAHHNQSVTVLRKMNYDHMGRVIKIYQNINSAPTDQLVSQYEYNDLGQLVDKKLHNTTGTSFLQSIDYRYNIRGWLSSLNNAQLNVNSANNDEPDDYFGMELSYNTVETGLSNAVLYNGGISASKWKSFGTVSGTTDQRSYKYTYDKANRLLTATSQMYTGTAWTKEVNAHDESMTFDHNGNIKTLIRNGRKHQLTGTVASYISETVDNLTYTYRTDQGNQLTKVEDAVPLATGVGDFKNNVNTTDEYTYNNDGNILLDQNKGISSITYTQLQKPAVVNFTDGRKIEYTYDASGNKLKMKTYLVSPATTTETDYLGGFVYENGLLNFFASPEGRVVKTGSTFEYQYAISDNQGNTRIVFSSVTPAPVAPIATFEGDANDGASQYLNVVPANVVSFTAANHTTSGTKVVRMNQTYKVGPSRNFKVYPNDKVDIEVWEYHEGSSGYGTTSTPATTLITMVAGAFGGVSGAPGESGNIFTGVNSAITALGTGGNQGSARPAAYLNYILFDQNYKVLDAGWQLAPATTFAKQRLFFNQLNIKEPGYLFAWLSYDDDSNNWVYFDDFKVTHTKSNIIQSNEYYPFGLQTSNSWTRENSRNSFLYNEGNELNSTSGWYETFFRGYDPTLGRFLQLDPAAMASQMFTPYNYAADNPVYFNDPAGLKEEPPADRSTMRTPGMLLSSLTAGYGSYGWEGAGPMYWVNNLRNDMASSNVLNFLDAALQGYGGTWSEGSADLFTHNESLNFGAIAKSLGHWESVVNLTATKNYSLPSSMGQVLSTVNLSPVFIFDIGGSDGWFDDPQGEVLFNHWLEGSGQPLSFSNKSWGDYMRADLNIWRYIDRTLKKDSKTRSTSGVFSKTIFAETSRNDYSSGYGLLHGTINLFIQVTATVTGDNIDYLVRASWNDEINPNQKYVKDILASQVLKAVYNPKDYQIKISWTQKFEGYDK